MLKERQVIWSEQKIAVEAIEKEKPVRMSYPKEVQYSCLAEFLFQKKSEQKAGTKAIRLKKRDIQMMQKLYIDSLAKVYENVRGVYIDLMKCIKPNAFLEI